MRCSKAGVLRVAKPVSTFAERASERPDMKASPGSPAGRGFLLLRMKRSRWCPGFNLKRPRERPSLRAKRSNPAFLKRQRKLDCFVASAFARRRASSDKRAPRNDDMRFAISRRDSPEVLLEFSLPSYRGRREDRVRAAPAVSCAICAKIAHTSIQVKRRHPAFPAQWVDGLCRDLLGDEFVLSPSSAN